LSANVSILESLAEDRTIAAYYSQAILSNFYNKEYLSPIETEEGIEYRNKDKDNSDVEDQIVKLQANPVSDVLSLIINNYKESNFEFEIRSIGGNLIFNQFISGKSFDIKLDVSQFDQGVYLVRIKDQNKQIYLNKFIKI